MHQLKLLLKLQHHHLILFKTTLETAVSEGWTKTKAVQELRKSEERMTIKMAKDLVKEAFEAKSEPIAIKA